MGEGAFESNKGGVQGESIELDVKGEGREGIVIMLGKGRGAVATQRQGVSRASERTARGDRGRTGMRVLWCVGSRVQIRIFVKARREV